MIWMERQQVPLYIAAIVLGAVVEIVMLIVGLAAGKIAKLDIPAQRALVFSGSTGDSLVDLPLALSLPAALNLVPMAVVTQTLVELVGMIVFIHLIPRLMPQRD